MNGRIQGYKMRGPFWCECAACGERVRNTQDAKREHEETQQHKDVVETNTTPTVLRADRATDAPETAESVLAAIAAFWGPENECDAPIYPGAYLTEKDEPIREVVKRVAKHTHATRFAERVCEAEQEDIANATWVPWQLAPDSDPLQRFILTTQDGETEHPAGLKFSSAQEATRFLENNPSFAVLPERWTGETINDLISTVESAEKGGSLMTKRLRDPEHMNEKRADWARQAVEAFAKSHRADPDSLVRDLLCDLMHYCDRWTQLEFDVELAAAQMHYEAETAPEVQP